MKALIIKHQEKIFPVLDVGLNGVNYFFHIFCSWYVSQQDYGTLNALLSILAILLVAGISFQTYTAKEAAQGGITAKRIYKAAFLYIGVLTCIFLLLLDYIMAFTRSSYLSLGLLFAVFLLNLFLSILRGVFQGEKQFFNLNMNFYFEVGSKMLFVILLLPRHNHINIVLSGLAFGMGIGVLHGIYKLKIKTLVVRGEGSVRPVARHLSFIFISNFFIYYFTSIDMVIFNYKAHDISGIYAVILRYSQIILFISFSLITVFLPNLSSLVKDEEAFAKKVKQYFLLLLGLQLFMLIGFKAVLPYTVELLFGSNYSEASPYLLRGGLMYTMLVNSFYLVNINITLNRRRYILPLGVVAVAMTTYLLIYGTSISTFLSGGTFFYTLLFLSLTTMYYFEGVKEYEKLKQ